ATVGGIFPHREPRAGCAPGLEHLRIGARLFRHPLDEIKDQGIEPVGHVIMVAMAAMMCEAHRPRRVLPGHRAGPSSRFAPDSRDFRLTFPAECSYNVLAVDGPIHRRSDGAQSSAGRSLTSCIRLLRTARPPAGPAR